ncbi:MAG: hypothetical protein COB98_02415 [Flavobacteriaceae bacterium]|nr:MAG: hypothetical protein COB98_02415 [Flavobacteriaceae bacterium]
MKRKLLYKTILLGLFLSITVSCEEDEISIPKENNIKIIGEWLMESYNYSGKTTTSVEGNNYVIDYVGTAINSDLVIDFKENKDVYTKGGYTIKLKTTSLGQTKTTTHSSKDLLKDGYNGTWEVKGDSLYTVTKNGDKSVGYIETLTENVLKVHTIDKRTQIIKDYKITIHTDLTIEYTKK